VLKSAANTGPLSPRRIPLLKLVWSSQPGLSPSKHFTVVFIQRFAIALPPLFDLKNVTPVLILDVSGLALSSQGAEPPTLHAHSL
jgi:hypothetical protein